MTSVEVQIGQLPPPDEESGEGLVLWLLPTPSAKKLFVNPTGTSSLM